MEGETRPLVQEVDRARVMAALACVDAVVLFDEDTPAELIKAIKPDILVKGADYEGKVVVGSEIAKEVRLVQFVEGKSTSNIINKAQQQ